MCEEIGKKREERGQREGMVGNRKGREGKGKYMHVEFPHLFNPTLTTANGARPKTFF